MGHKQTINFLNYLKKALIIKNKKNMGKGFSIKKAFRFILKKKSNIDGVIIA